MSLVNDNKACCTVPPVQAEYTPKGRYEDIKGLHTYVTGPAESATAILFVFDIFKFSAQGLQGADLLAADGTKVIMPDFFKGETMDPSWFDTDDPDSQRLKQAFFAGPASPKDAASAITTLLAYIRSSGADKVGAVGFCWGAKAITVAAAHGADMDAIALVHPSQMTADDANGINVPTCLLPSNGEDPEVMSTLNEVLSSKPFADKNVYKVFDDCIHGWAGARADLKTEKGRKDFKEAYDILHTFFKTNLV